MPLDQRKDIGRIHRNLAHASADQLEKLFRDANVSDEAVSALKHFRCDSCDRLKRPPSKRRVGGESRRDLQRHCIHGCEFLENFLQGTSSCEDDNEGVEHRGCRIRYAYCFSDC